MLPNSQEVFDCSNGRGTQNKYKVCHTPKANDVLSQLIQIHSFGVCCVCTYAYFYGHMHDFEHAYISQGLTITIKALHVIV